MDKEINYRWIYAHATEVPGDPQNWPYTDEFRDWLELYNRQPCHEPLTPHEMYNECLDARKDRFKTIREAERFPLAVKRRPPEPSRLAPDAKALLVELCNTCRERVPRDRLPYTAEFMAICGRINAQFPADQYTERDVWLAVLQLAKAKLMGKGNGPTRKGGHRKDILAKRKGFGIRG